MLDKKEYVSPLIELHQRHIEDVREAETGQNRKLAKHIAYRTEEKHFKSMIPRRDFRLRGTIIHRDKNFRN